MALYPCAHVTVTAHVPFRTSERSRTGRRGHPGRGLMMPHPRASRPAASPSGPLLLAAKAETPKRSLRTNPGGAEFPRLGLQTATPCLEVLRPSYLSSGVKFPYRHARERL